MKFLLTVLSLSGAVCAMDQNCQNFYQDANIILNLMRDSSYKEFKNYEGVVYEFFLEKAPDIFHVAFYEGKWIYSYSTGISSDVMDFYFSNISIFGREISFQLNGRNAICNNIIIMSKAFEGYEIQQRVFCQKNDTNG